MRYRGARGKGKEKQMRNGIVIDKRDNVVVAIYELEGGTEVTVPQDRPRGHRRGRRRDQVR